jgi:acyl-CoA synthetase (AMP-forming)/AMP-acid ligase II
MNISNLLIESAAHRPEHPAIRFLERTITYKELNRQVDRLSHGLVRAGLHPRDVCVLMMPNSIDWAIVYPVRNNAPLLCSGVRFYNNSGGV